MSYAATATSTPISAFADVQALAAADMQAVNALIRRRLASDVVLVNQVAEHIVGGGGKRLRPLLHLVAARAAGYRGRDQITLAAVIEFIHTATLLHDDVVDESDLRRGRQTANAVWGNAPSVLVGDFLYSRAFQMMVELDRMRVMRILADTTNRIAEGEVLQLLNIGNPDTDEAAYLDVIERKTAVLFAAATRLGALLGGLALGVWLLPLTGLFMSIIYPTLNSKAISCFPRHQHGAAAGVILFFTAVAAAVGPLAMAAVSDALGDIKFGFVLATGFALLLFAGLALNWRLDPAGARLAERNESDYAAGH